MKQRPRHLLKHVDSRVQPSKSQQLLVRSRVNLETQNVSWTVEKNSRRFRPSWFDHDEWKTYLHYDQEKDAALCFTCIKTVEQNLISSKNVEKAFISAGYKNWSDAATSGRGFNKHNRSDAHTEAHQRLYIIPKQCEDIGEQISQTHAEEKSVSRQALLKILSNIRFLA